MLRIKAQRIKLTTELQRAPRGHTLYILDEPTTGLHPMDVSRLIAQLERIVDAGNSVIEHDMDVISRSDWIIDLGPGAGNEGGRIVAAGTPKTLVAGDGLTARYLRRRQAQEDGFTKTPALAIGTHCRAGCWIIRSADLWVLAPSRADTDERQPRPVLTATGV